MAGIGDGGLGGAENVRDDEGRGWESGSSWIVGGAENAGTCQGVYDEAPDSVLAAEVSGGSSWFKRLYSGDEGNKRSSRRWTC